MNNYEVDLCPCGRIHIIPNSQEWMKSDYKRNHVYKLCRHCGRLVEEFFTKEESESMSSTDTIREVFVHHYREIKDETIGIFTDAKSIRDRRVWISCGMPVPMIGGDNANIMQNGIFSHVDPCTITCSIIDSKLFLRHLWEEYYYNEQEVNEIISHLKTKIKNSYMDWDADWREPKE